MAGMGTVRDKWRIIVATGRPICSFRAYTLPPEMAGARCGAPTTHGQCITGGNYWATVYLMMGWRGERRRTSTKPTLRKTGTNPV